MRQSRVAGEIELSGAYNTTLVDGLQCLALQRCMGANFDFDKDYCAKVFGDQIDFANWRFHPMGA